MVMWTSKSWLVEFLQHVGDQTWRDRNVRYILEIIIYDHKCSFLVCFKIFDADNDGVLNEDEVSLMIESMLEVAGQTKTGEKERVSPTLLSRFL